MFAGVKLPGKLSRAVSNLSTTVQVLLSEIVLAVEGYEDRQRSEAGKLDYAQKNKRATEARERDLQEYLNAVKIHSTDAAIGVAAVAGRSTREIADFFEVEQMFAMRRLCEIRKRAEGFRPRRRRVRQMVQLAFSFFTGEATQDTTDILETFAEASHRGR